MHQSRATLVRIKAALSLNLFVQSTDWQFDYKDPTEQCANLRQGYLCGSCPPGEALSSAIYTGQCTNLSTCMTWGTSIGVTLAVVVPVVPLILYLDLPLSNDIKGLVFFYAVVRMLFYQSDFFVYQVDVSLLYAAGQLDDVYLGWRWCVWLDNGCNWHQYADKHAHIHTHPRTHTVTYTHTHTHTHTHTRARAHTQHTLFSLSHTVSSIFRLSLTRLVRLSGGPCRCLTSRSRR